jgi:hypothetical protein
LEEVLDIEQMQENLTNQIELKAHPVNVTLPPPFPNTVEEQLGILN